MTDIAPVTDAAPAVDTAPVTDTTPVADAFEDEKVQQFDRAYVTKLREEAASYRTKAAAAKQYEDAFGGYSDDERAVWMDLATGLVSDAPATAKRFQEIAAAILGNTDAPAAAAPVADAAAEDAPMTKAQMQAFLAERDKASDLDRRVATIKSTATELGYKEGTVAYRTLLLTAQEGDGDIAKAHAAIQADRQAAVDAYLASKKADAEGSASVGGAGDGSTAGKENKIKTFAQASDALREMMKAGG